MSVSLIPEGIPVSQSKWQLVKLELNDNGSHVQTNLRVNSELFYLHVYKTDIIYIYNKVILRR